MKVADDVVVIVFGFVGISEMEVVERLGNAGVLEMFDVSPNAFLLPVSELEPRTHFCTSSLAAFSIGFSGTELL